MVAKKTTKTRAVYEDRQETVPAKSLIASVLCYGLAILLGYLAVGTPESGTAMGAIRGVLFGLGGSVAILLPIAIAWLGTLAALRASGKRVSVIRFIGDGLLFVLLFTAVQLFSTEEIIVNHMVARTFFNYIVQSYRVAIGGGALGGLLAWPLYTLVGKWGGLIAVLLLACLVMTFTGAAQRALAGLRGATQRAAERRSVRSEEEPARVREPRVAPSRQTARPRRPRASDPDADLRSPETASRPRSPSAKRNAHTDMDQMPPLPGEEKPKRCPKVDVPDSLRETPSRKRRVSPLDVGDGVDFAPELLGEEKIAPRVQEEPPKPKKKPAKQKRESEQSDLTIEPDASDVFASDEPSVAPKPLPKLKRGKPAPAAEDETPYNYPPIDLLEQGERIVENHRESDMEKAELLEDTLKEFGISTKLSGIAHGPAVTRFELQPAPGVKVSRITSLSDDIAMHLAAMSVRIEAPIPGKNAVGVEIPNDRIEMVRLRDVLESQEARKSASRIAVGLGKDNSGRYIVADIAKMPHVLIAGQTGSGKSVCINSIITSILFRATPDEVKLILIDPKVVELSIYNDIPHLVCPVVTDCKKAASALDWAVAEMERRYKEFAKKGVRDIKGFNKALGEDEKPMPQMVIIIDELADLMMVAPGEVEDSICRLAQLARACGMHLVIATQRPSVNVITGIIKANIPTRIAFSVASQVDSRTMIDHGGAEKLLGNGDMLFVPSGINKPMRVQGAWVSDEEVHAIVSYIKERSEINYDLDMIERMENAARTDAEKEEVAEEYDDRLPEAVEIVVEAGQASVSMLQRRMRVGYARAGRLIDEMQRRGIVSDADGAKPRSVLISREQMNELFEDEE